ncbi:hypothetical protein FXN61_35000 [Lentzea sp. PSKA42]|uniref:Alanine--tRNA ligase n=1 Tax=Lentzea indica TaxID=2604800 RepID=A0ABX1FRP4_9PSEU|nr:hypothetical protein [Lentzea indica]NKE61689.1 hypothetical protein [Lentzea indica]
MSFDAQVDAHLRERHWTAATCPACSRLYYAKKPAESCGSLKCAGRYFFTELSGRRRSSALIDLTDRLGKTFVDAGIPSFPAVPAINSREDTLFIVAGIQAIYPGLYETGAVPADRQELGPRFVAQPSVRWNSHGHVADGITTSFVNTCLLESPSSPARHLELLDLWLDTLSGLGLFAGHFRLVLRRTETERLVVWKLHINHGGLELGDAAYVESPAARISDLGLGLERIAWALGGGSYFDSLGPWPFVLHAPPRLVDSLRTLTLLVASGGRPGTRSVGQRVRRLAKDCAEFLPLVPVEQVAGHYHRFWSAFAELPVPVEQTVAEIRREVDGRYLRAICDELGTAVPAAAGDLDARLWALAGQGATTDDVRRAGA